MARGRQCTYRRVEEPRNAKELGLETIDAINNKEKNNQSKIADDILPPAPVPLSIRPGSRKSPARPWPARRGYGEGARTEVIASQM